MLFDEIDEEIKEKDDFQKTSINRKTKFYYLENNFEDFNKNCIEHTSNKIVGLCIEENCNFNRLMCTECIFQNHVKHNMININNVVEKYNDLKKFNQEIENSKKRIK